MRDSIHPEAAPVRRSLFRKYFIALLAAVIVPITASGISNAWFGYRDQRAMLSALLRVEATSAAGKMQSFLDGIRDQLSWTVQQAWNPDAEGQHRLDALRAMRQAPAIVSITLVDSTGVERLHVSRIGLNRMESGSDRSGDPAVAGARSTGLWYGPVTFRNGSEPFLTMAMAGNRKADAFVVAEINLKLIWIVVSEVRVGRSGQAFVLDQTGRLIAHPDISKVLQGTDENTAAARRRLRDEIATAGGEATTARN
ncbi:MAG: adenylate/guanylate cyclase domain-containing protein, partial [Mesorhizobium sp.]